MHLPRIKKHSLSFIYYEVYISFLRYHWAEIEAQNISLEFYFSYKTKTDEGNICCSVLNCEVLGAVGTWCHHFYPSVSTHFTSLTVLDQAYETWGLIRPSWKKREGKIRCPYILKNVLVMGEAFPTNAKVIILSTFSDGPNICLLLLS